MQGGVVGGFLLLHLFELLRVGLDVGFGGGFALAGIGEFFFGEGEFGADAVLFGQCLAEGGLRAEQFVGGFGLGEGGGEDEGGEGGAGGHVVLLIWGVF